MSNTAGVDNKWILVVDDDPDIRECLVGILDDQGYSVAEADNGQVALETIEKRGVPCIVILDLMMPVMDGVSFLQTVDQLPVKSSLEVIVASAASSAEREAVRRFPVVRHVLSKPFELNDLLELVQGCQPAGRATPPA